MSDEYSRARADAEAEHREMFQQLANHIGALKSDAVKSLQEYKGKQENSHKIMAAYYHSRISAYTEILGWLEFYCSIQEETTK